MTAVASEPVVVTEAGIWPDMDEATYHGDPVPAGSLSSSGARAMLPPSYPALYRHEADNGRKNKREYDFGHVAHKLTLGKGADIAIVEYDSWRTKDAQEQDAAARAVGQIPILRKHYAAAEAMHEALLADEICAALFDPETGVAETSWFWTDPEFGVWRRARLDWWRTGGHGRPTIVDYKTADSIDPAAISRHVNSYGYHMQQPYYTDAVNALTGEVPAFLFIFQSKTPPYLTVPVQLDDDAVRVGRERNAVALERFRDCQASGIWPGPVEPNTILTVSLPAYAERAHIQELFS